MCKIPKMTYNVSSATLNPTVLILTCKCCRRRFWHATLRLRSTIHTRVENEDVWSSKLELPLVARNANAG